MCLFQVKYICFQVMYIQVFLKLKFNYMHCQKNMLKDTCIVKGK